MFRVVQHFLNSDTPTRSQAALSLRVVFALAFLGQLGVVASLWLGLLIFTEPRERSVPFTGEALVGLSILQFFLALFVGRLSANVKAKGGKEAALSAVIAQGVIFSTPAWFTLFAWLVGEEPHYFLLLFALLGLYYFLGLLFAGRYTNTALLKGR